MMSETQNMEYKRLWKDEYLKWICAFANAQGGQLLIGVDDDGTPVGLPDGWTVETLLSAHASKPRNKHIAQVFYRAGFIENWGCGIGNISRGLQEAGLPQPIFSAHCGGMLLTLPRPEEVVKALEEEYQSSNVDSKVSSKVTSKVSSKANNAELTEKQRVVLHFCKTPHSASEIMNHLGVVSSKHSRKKYIHDLIAVGLLVMTDPNSPRSPQQKYVTVTK